MHNPMQNSVHNSMDEGQKETSVKKPTKNFQSLCWNAFWPGLALACITLPALPIFGGCAFVPTPEPEPTPTKVPDVHINPDVYKPVAEATNVQALSDNLPSDGGGKNLIPDYYQVVGADAGDLLTIQAYRLTKPEAEGGTPYLTQFDKPVKVKLGGVFSPGPGQRGWAEARGQTLSWLGGRRLQVDQDKKYPITIDGRVIVQIRIESEISDGKGGKTMEPRPFNQLLVRAGYAFVDLVSPTSLDYKSWIIDEEYARGVRKEPAAWQLLNHPAGQPTPTPAPGIPVGLWARGIHPPFRAPALVRAQGTVAVISGGNKTPGTKTATVKTQSKTATVIKNP